MQANVYACVELKTTLRQTQANITGFMNWICLAHFLLLSSFSTLVQKLARMRGGPVKLCILQFNASLL